MKEEKEQTVIEKTLLYLENYREMERYINEAVSETSQVPDIGKYNISAEKAFLQSVRECRAETVILFEHLKKALASLKEDAEAAGEGYKYDALEAVYIKGMSYEDIVRETGCGRNSPKKWCRSMTEKELGGGTGQIKLRYVYDMFVARFTWLARVISFEAFSMMVDEALERMKKMLESNKAMQTLVSGEAGETVEKDM